MRIVIHAQMDEDNTITTVVSSMSYNSALGTRINNTTVDDTISINGALMPFDTFLKNLKHFTISTAGIVSYITGSSISSLDDSIITLDTSVPLSFIRANTVVNFGRL